MQEKLDVPELAKYWEGVHDELRQAQPAEALLVENNPWIVNRYDHYGHLLGVLSNLKAAGDLKGKRILDIGCGRGRWCRFFSQRGAQVTGVDWSETAIAHARKAAPAADIRRMSITDLAFDEGSFDAVNSVTVIQHLPWESHAPIFREAARVLRAGGLLLCVELTAGQRGQHVFPRRPQEWCGLAEAAGLQMIRTRGCNYDLLLTPYRLLVQTFRKQAFGLAPGQPAQPSTTGVGFYQKANRVFLSALAFANFPLERPAQLLPVNCATHAAMVFRKPPVEV